MTKPGEQPDGASLWRQWRPLAQAAPGLDAPEIAMALASYAEGRLNEVEAELIESWLVDHPEALADLIAARSAETEPASAAPEAVVARAAALIATPDGNVLAFHGSAVHSAGWRRAAAWSGLAASLLVTSLFGFAFGNNAYMALLQRGTAAESTSYELLDPPSGLLSVEDEEPAT